MEAEAESNGQGKEPEVVTVAHTRTRKRCLDYWLQTSIVLADVCLGSLEVLLHDPESIEMKPAKSIINRATTSPSFAMI